MSNWCLVLSYMTLKPYCIMLHDTKTLLYYVT